LVTMSSCSTRPSSALRAGSGCDNNVGVQPTDLALGSLRGGGFRGPRGFAGRGGRAGHRHRVQNFPEGTAVAMPLRREGMSRAKSFFYGQLSAVVEPVAGVLGAAAVVLAKPILPYALAFAAGAMIFVVAEELVPEAKRGSPDIAAMSVMVGFAVMTLDVALG
jgi:ZIP family zinc transporter